MADEVLTIDPAKFEQLSAGTQAPAQPAQDGVVEVDPAQFEQAAHTAAVGKLESTLRGLAQGATFGFADELSGAVQAMAGKSYVRARDESRAAFRNAERANPKSFLGGELGGGLLTAFVPGLGWLNAGKTAVAAAGAGAAAGALAGLGKTEATNAAGMAADVVKGGAIGGALGGAIGGVLQAVSRSRLPDAGKKILMDSGLDAVSAGKPMSRGAMGRLEQFLHEGDNSAKLYDAALKKMEKLPPEELVPPAITASKKEFQGPADFINFTLRRDAGAKIGRQSWDKFRDTIESMSEEGRAAHWNNYKSHEAHIEAMGELLDDMTTKALPQMKDPMGFRKLFTRFQDPMFAGRQTDNVTGLNFEGVVGNGAQATRLMTLHAAPYMKQWESLTAATRKLFKDPKQVGRYLDDSAVAKGELGELNVAQSDLINKWRTWFNDVHDSFDRVGLKVSKLNREYFPMQQMAPRETQRALKARYEQIAAEHGGYRPEIDEDLDRALLELNGGVAPRSTAQVEHLIDSVLTPKIVKEHLGSEAFAAFRRQGEVPEVIRNYDVSEAAHRYLMGNLKAGYYKPVYDQLHTNIALLKGLGLDKTADYWTGYFKRISGEPSDWYATAQYQADKWRNHWDDFLARDDLGMGARALGKTARAVPEMLSWMTSVAYPNLLGWNLYAPIRNMSQTWATTAPELGGKWGAQMTTRGWLQAAKAARSGGVTEFLKSKGLLGDTFEGEAAEKLIDAGMRSIPGMSGAVRGIEKAGQLGMKLYTATDTANRFLTWHIGQEVAKDLLSDSTSKAGAEFLRRLPAGMKADVRALMRTGKSDELGDALGRYLIRKTQFDYGKANLHQFGQDYGKMASMFMKWPSVILSDVDELVRTRKGIDKLMAPMKRYVAPLALLAAGQQFLDEAGATKSPIAKLALGNSLTAWAPASAVLGLERTPPLINAAQQGLGALSDVVQGELGHAGDRISKTFEPFIPGYGAAATVKRRLDRAFNNQ